MYTYNDIYIYIYTHMCVYIYIYMYIWHIIPNHMESPPWINKPPPLIKSRGQQTIINTQIKYQDILINAKHKYNLESSRGWSWGCPKVLRVSGTQKVLCLINTLYVQLITCWGVSLWEKMDDPQDDPQDDPAGISRHINKVLARI